MKNRDKIEDSLDFCKDIKYYESEDKRLLFDSDNYPNLKEYINWVDRTDQYVGNDYVSFENMLDLTETSLNPKAETVKEKPKESLLKSVYSFLMELIICVVISVTIVFLVTSFVVTHTKVIGHSMQDTLNQGEYLLINRLTYQFSDPKQFDIVVFKHSEEDKYIKRVIATPGQKIQIINSKIYVDDKIVNENYGNAPITDPGNAAEPIFLGEDEYFVLGDNRNHSSDSRFDDVGLVKRDKIQGKVLLRIYPIDKFGTVD